MKTFREHLNEEVKIGALSSGGIDIERDAVRDEINGILAGIAARPCVTPYSSLNKVRKALAYFSIFLPKRVYLEGRHGVEVWEVKQFGDKMGVTDQGEWIHHVPAKYHLFFHYHMVGSMYYLQAKIVDDKELEKRINDAEAMIAEAVDAATRLDVSKQSAPKEPMHDVTSDKKKVGNKKAVAQMDEEELDEADAANDNDHDKPQPIQNIMSKEYQDTHPSPFSSKSSTDGNTKDWASRHLNVVKEAKKIKVKLNPEKEVGYTVHDVGPGGKKTLSQSGKTKVKDIKEEQIDELYGKGQLEKIRSERYKKLLATRDKVPTHKNPNAVAVPRSDNLRFMRDSQKVARELGFKKDINYPSYRDIAKVDRAEQKRREKESGIKEEILDEISKDLAQRYRNKASKYVDKKHMEAGRHPSAKTLKGKQGQMQSKASGLKKAADRMGHIELAKKKFKSEKGVVAATSKYEEYELNEGAHKALKAAGFTAGRKGSDTGFGRSYSHPKHGSAYVDADGFAHFGSGKKTTVTHGAKDTAAHLGKLKEEQIDEVSKKLAIRAYADTQDPGYDGEKDDTGERIRGHIRKKWGDKMVRHADNHSYNKHWQGHEYQKDDRLADKFWNRPSSDMRKTKDGKIHKQDQKIKRAEIKQRLKSAPHKKVNLPEETINELHGKGSLPKIIAHHKKESDKAYGMALRQKYQKDHDRYQDKSDDHYNEVHRAERLQKKLNKEETINEISHKLALKAMKKSEKRSEDEYEKDMAYDRLSDHQTHDERASRLRKHMTRKFGNPKPGRGDKEGDSLSNRTMSDRLKHGKRAGMPSREHITRLKTDIKVNKALGKNKKVNLPEGVGEPITGARTNVGSSDRKRKAVQMALGRKHKGEEGWNDKINPQTAALRHGRALQKKGVNEEQIDELSYNTVRRYKKKASNDLSSAKTYHSWNIDQDYANPKTREKSVAWSGNQVVKREKGIAMANKRLAKEETLSELSYDTVKRYHMKAVDRYQTGEESHEKRKKGRELATRKRAGGMMGIPKAKVMAKEETLDEVSLGKLVRYKKAASDDLKHQKNSPVGRGDWWKQGDTDDPENRRKEGIKLADKKMKGKAKVNASMPKHPYMEETISEKAPPGAKYERMVKHIKAGYAKDGLTKKEKGIAFATAWKAKNREDSKE